MPVTLDFKPRKLSQDEFGAIALLPTYEEGLTEKLLTEKWGKASVVQGVEVIVGGEPIGKQTVLCAAPRVAFQLTTLKDGDQHVFEDHLCRFLSHTALDAIQWINVTRAVVSFRTLRPRRTRKG